MSKNSSSENIDIVDLLVSLLFIVPIILLNGYTIMNLWNWFICECNFTKQINITILRPSHLSCFLGS